MVTPGRFDEEAARIAQQQDIELIDGQSLWPEVRPYIPNAEAAVAAPAAVAPAPRALALAWGGAGVIGALAWTMAQGMQAPAEDDMPPAPPVAAAPPAPAANPAQDWINPSVSSVRVTPMSKAASQKVLELVEQFHRPCFVLAIDPETGVCKGSARTISKFHLGDAIDVHVDATGAAAFPGRVTAIAPAADPQSRVFDVEVSIANEAGQLRPGMIGAVTLLPRATDTSAARPLTVPLTAVVRSNDAGQFAVAVIQSVAL